MMRRWSGPAVVVAVVAVVTGALGGCGSSTATSASTTASSATTAPPTTAVTTTSNSTTSEPVTASVPASTSSAPPTTTTGACRAGDLAAALHGAGNGAAGTIYYTIKATNVTSVACSTGGYFGVSTYNVDGQPISTQDERIQQSALRDFVLAPGQSLSFQVGLSDVDTATQASCPQVGALHLIPPNDTHYVQLSLLNAAAQGPQIVNCTGNLPVSPVVAS